MEGHSKATMCLIFNNAAQGILSSFFFKYAGKSPLLNHICLSFPVPHGHLKSPLHAPDTVIL
jgi:hypothetical protein